MWNYRKNPGHQSGFTLVELAIVLVIIGLILGAVLKGQEMITNAKVKNVANDLRGVGAAFYAYQDRYHAIPGDDAAASLHVTGGVNGGGNGVISGLFNATSALAAGTESQNFWQHTRLAGFTTGAATSTAAVPPANALGGILGIEDGSAAAAVFGMTGPAACSSNIPWKIAQAVDTMIDDGDSTTGSVRTGAAATVQTAATTSAVYGGAVAAPANTDTLHTICMKI